MTRVVVNPGNCGFTTTIEVSKVANRRARVVITSDCERVTELGESLTELDTWEVFKQYADNAIYKGASRCHLHITCPVPTGILKAIEVEAGLAVSCDVVIRFETQGTSSVFLSTQIK